MGQRDILRLIAKLLAKAKIPYLLTGSFAVSYYGFPRATHDIDFIIETMGKNVHKLYRLIVSLDKSYIVDKQQIKEAVLEPTQFDIFHKESGTKIDFWLTDDDEFEKIKFKRGREVHVNRQKVNIISPEDLILTKLTWCKKIMSERHMQDCRGIYLIQKEMLDKKYLSSWGNKLGVTDLLEEILK